MAPRIYVADLAAYNAGRLNGRWIDLEEYPTVEDIERTISTFNTGEEWAIHDYEGFGGISIGEHDSLETIIAHVERMSTEPRKYEAYVRAHGSHYADQYDADKVSGPYESVEAWFDSYIEGYYGHLDIELLLIDGGFDRREAAALSELLTFITPEQFELIMSANYNVSLVRVPVDPTGNYSVEYYEVSE